jgi:hypothetical protein
MALQLIGSDTDCQRTARARRRPEHEVGRLVSADPEFPTRKLDHQHLAGQKMTLRDSLDVRLSNDVQARSATTDGHSCDH